MECRIGRALAVCPIDEKGLILAANPRKLTNIFNLGVHARNALSNLAMPRVYGEHVEAGQGIGWRWVSDGLAESSTEHLTAGTQCRRLPGEAPPQVSAIVMTAAPAAIRCGAASGAQGGGPYPVAKEERCRK